MANESHACVYKMPQFSGKKPAPGHEPVAPLDYLPADGMKQPGGASGGTGVKSHKTRQQTGNKKLKAY
jgi:hypothetical protein